MKWIKPSGLEIETNDLDETIDYCESLGWKEAGSKPDEKQIIADEAYRNFGVKISRTKTVENMQKELDKLIEG